MVVSLLPKQWHLIWLAHKSLGLIILLSAGLQHYALSAFDASVSAHTLCSQVTLYLPQPGYSSLSTNPTYHQSSKDENSLVFVVP